MNGRTTARHACRSAYMRSGGDIVVGPAARRYPTIYSFSFLKPGSACDQNGQYKIPRPAEMSAAEIVRTRGGLAEAICRSIITLIQLRCHIRPCPYQQQLNSTFPKLASGRSARSLCVNTTYSPYKKNSLRYVCVIRVCDVSAGGCTTWAELLSALSNLPRPTPALFSALFPCLTDCTTCSLLYGKETWACSWPTKAPGEPFFLVAQAWLSLIERRDHSLTVPSPDPAPQRGRALGSWAAPALEVETTHLSTKAVDAASTVSASRSGFVSIPTFASASAAALAPASALGTVTTLTPPTSLSPLSGGGATSINADTRTDATAVNGSDAFQREGSPVQQRQPIVKVLLVRVKEL